MSLRDSISASLPPALARVLHWEFWPTWAVYSPLAPYVAWLAIRHGGAGLPFAANTFPPLAMLAGESKFEILSRIAPDARPAHALVDGATIDAKRATFDAALRAEPALEWPLILKPDRGYRGQGLRLCRTIEEAHAALRLHRGATIVQNFARGDRECGLLYVREPGASAGRIISVTTKRFPIVEGDGRRSIQDLIDADTRLRLQRVRFLARLRERASVVPASGARVPLAISGNHCQGTQFLDGSRLGTPALTARLDALAKAVPGLCFGRFDVRYASDEGLMLGEGLEVLELNGIASEPTHVYAPDVSIRRAYMDLARTLRWLYMLGAMNVARGEATAPGLWEAIARARREGELEMSDALAD